MTTARMMAAAVIVLSSTLFGLLDATLTTTPTTGAGVPPPLGCEPVGKGFAPGDDGPEGPVDGPPLGPLEGPLDG